VAAQRAAERRRQQRNRLLIVLGSIGTVIAIVVVIVVVNATTKPSSTSTSTPVTGVPLPASVAGKITNVPGSTLDAVGAGSVPSVTSKPVTTLTGSPPLTSGGKPEMLYIGAEFCPYCAAMRWSMAVALSRFGTLSPLHGIHSAPKPEVYPDTATLTFYKTSYSSKYLAFTPVENEKINHAPLQATTTEQQKLWDKYNANSYPFIDIGNKYMVTVLYDPQVLAGKTWAQIASALHDPSSPIARGVLGAANYLTAAICKVTGNSPAGVCSSAAVTSVRGKF
ncbi:MAG TPA: DUF929 family protein, partial [Mycobacterium sp.]|nr:DUF929 family protein [Mycobacterium sp.]